MLLVEPFADEELELTSVALELVVLGFDAVVVVLVEVLLASEVELILLPDVDVLLTEVLLVSDNVLVPLLVVGVLLVAPVDEAERLPVLLLPDVVSVVELDGVELSVTVVLELNVDVVIVDKSLPDPEVVVLVDELSLVVDAEVTELVDVVLIALTEALVNVVEESVPVVDEPLLPVVGGRPGCSINQTRTK